LRRVVARGTAQVVERGAQAAARGGARCFSKIIERGAQAVAAAATLSQQEKINSADVQRKNANCTRRQR
jgi:hypothetical protein